MRLIDQNTNSELYLKNENSQWCIICDLRRKRTVNHYKTSHGDREVFVARLSPEMTDTVKMEGIPVDRIIKRYTKYLEATCPFCEVKKSFSTQYWILHMRSHTGEYMNKCQRCDKFVCFNSHCGQSTSKTDNFDLRLNDLNAFLCSKCNFIQIDKENVRKHLQNEHGETDVDEHIKEVTLLPSWTIPGDGVEQNTGKFFLLHIRTSESEVQVCQSN